MAEINNAEDIKLNFEKITNLINSMRAQGVLSSSSVDKILSSISEKIDNISVEENTEMIKLLINELKNNTDERHRYIVAKFSEVEDSVKSLISTSDNAMETAEIKKLFDVIATNLTVFSKEVLAQKESLSSIMLQIDSIKEDKRDRDDVLDSISVLKQDITKINNGFESIILNINNNFEELASSFQKLADVSNNGKITKSIDNVAFTSNAILSSIQMLDKKNADLNQRLENLASVADFRRSEEILLAITNQQNDLSSIIENTANKENIKGLSEVINVSINAISELKSTLVDNADLKNQELISQLENLENRVKTTAENFNFTQFKSELFGIVNEIGNETNQICNDLLETNTDLKRILTAVNLADFNTNIQNINTSILESSSMLKNAFDETYEKISVEHKDSTSVVVDNFNFQMSELASKLETFRNEVVTTGNISSDTINNNMNNFVELVNRMNSNIDQSSIKTIEELNSSILLLKNDLSTIKEDVHTSSNSSFEDFSLRLDELFETSNILKENIVEQISENSQKINYNLNELSGKISKLREEFATSEASNSVEFQQKLSEFEGVLQNFSIDLSANADVISSKVVENLSKVYSYLNTFSDDFKNAYSAESEDVKLHITEIYNKISELNGDVPTLLFQSSGKISELVSNLQVKFDETNNNIEKLTASISNNETHNIAIDRMDAVNQDIKFVVNNLVAQVLENNDSLYAKVDEITQNINVISENLSEHINSSNAGVSDKINTLSEVMNTIKGEVQAQANINQSEDIKKQLENISSDIKFAILETKNNPNSDVYVEKLDKVSANALELKDLLVSSTNDITSGIIVKLSESTNDIKNDVGNISEQIKTQSETLNENLSSVSKEVKTVTEKLANYFINNDSDINLTLNSINDKLESSSLDAYVKFNSLNDKFIETLDSINSVSENHSGQTDLINSNISNTSSLLSEKIDNINFDIKSVTSDILNKFIEEYDRNKKDVENIHSNINNVKNELTEEIVSKVDKNFDSITNNINEIKNEILNTSSYEMNELNNGIISKFNDLKPEIIDTIEILINNSLISNNGMISSLDVLKSELSSKIDEIVRENIVSKNDIHSHVEDMKVNLESLLDRVIHESQVSKDNVHTAIEASKNAVLSQVDEILANMNCSKEDFTSLLSYTASVDTIDNAVKTLVETIDGKDLLFDSKTNEIIYSIKDTISELKNDTVLSQENIKTYNDEKQQEMISRIESLGTELKTLEDMFKETSYNNNSEILNNIRSVSSLIINLSEDNKSSLENIIADTNNKISSIPQKIDYAQNAVIEKIEELGFSEDERKLDIINKINDLNYSVSEKTDRSYENITDIINQLSEKFSELADKTDSSNSSEVISSELQEIKSMIRIVDTELFNSKNITDEQSQKLSNIVGSINNLLSMITESETSIIERFESEVSLLKLELSNVQNQSRANKDNIIESISSKMGSIEEYLSKIDEKQDDQKAQIFSQIIDSVDEIKNIAEDSDLKISDSINKLESIKNSSIEMMDEFKAILNNKLSEIGSLNDLQNSTIANNIELLKSTIISKTEVEDKFNDIEGYLITLSKELSSLGVQSLAKEDLNNFKTEIVDIQEGIRYFISENYNQKTDFITSEVKQNIENILDSITNTLNNQETKIVTSIGRIDSRFDNTDNSLSTIVSEIESIKSIVSSSESDEHISEQLNSIQSEFGNIIENIKDVGVKNDEVINSYNDNVKARIEELQSHIDNSNSARFDAIMTLCETLAVTLRDMDSNIDEDATRQLSIIKDELASVTAILYSNTDRITLNIDENFTDFQEKFENVVEQINTFQNVFTQETTSNISAIKSEFEGLNHQLSKNEELRVQISALEASLQKHFESIALKLDDFSIQEHFDICTNKIDGIDSKIDKIDFTSQSLEDADRLIISNIETITNKLGSVESSLEDILNNSLEQEMENVKNIIDEQGQIFSILSTREDISILPKMDDINISIKENTAHLLDNFNRKIEECSTQGIIAKELEILKSEILTQAIKILDQVSFEFEKDEILDSVQENTNYLKSYVSEIKAELSDLITKNNDNLLESLLNKSDIDSIHQKLDDLSDNYELKKGFDDVNARIDSIVENVIDNGFENINIKIDGIVENTIEKEFSQISSRLEFVANNDDLVDGFESISSKLDFISDNTELQKGFEDVSAMLDTVAKSSELQKGFGDVSTMLDTVAKDENLHKEFSEVKKHLQTIQSGDNNNSYTYSLQDVETDIAKLRIAMKELTDVSGNDELQSINLKIEDILLVIDSIKNQISQAELDEVTSYVNKINEDIVSISTRTNKLLIASDNSGNMLKENIEHFRLVMDDIDERTRDLIENTNVKPISHSISNIEKTFAKNADYNYVVNQSLMSIAEWVDCAGVSLSNITDRLNSLEKLDNIEDVKMMIREIDIPNQIDSSVFENIEEQFVAQQLRIDTLESKLDKLMELVESNDNTQITKKITSVDKQLAKLNKSIERLTSYVDEE